MTTTIGGENLKFQRKNSIKKMEGKSEHNRQIDNSDVCQIITDKPTK